MIDLDGGGDIDLQEFTEMMTMKLKNTTLEDQLLQTCSFLDPNHTEHITENKIRLILNFAAHKIENKVIDDIIQKIDKKQSNG